MKKKDSPHENINIFNKKLTNAMCSISVKSIFTRALV